MAFEDGKKLKIFTGNANPELAKEICDYLGLPQVKRLQVALIMAKYKL